MGTLSSKKVWTILIAFEYLAVISGGLQLLNSSMNILAEIGENVTLLCVFDENVNCGWKLNKIYVEMGKRYMYSHKNGINCTNCSLDIWPLRCNDTEHEWQCYGCIPENPNKCIFSENITIDIIEKQTPAFSTEKATTIIFPDVTNNTNNSLTENSTTTPFPFPDKRSWSSTIGTISLLMCIPAAIILVLSSTISFICYIRHKNVRNPLEEVDVELATKQNSEWPKVMGRIDDDTFINVSMAESMYSLSSQLQISSTNCQDNKENIEDSMLNRTKASTTINETAEELYITLLDDDSSHSDDNSYQQENTIMHNSAYLTEYSGEELYVDAYSVSRATKCANQSGSDGNRSTEGFSDSSVSIKANSSGSRNNLLRTLSTIPEVPDFPSTLETNTAESCSVSAEEAEATDQTFDEITFSSLARSLNYKNETSVM